MSQSLQDFENLLLVKSKEGKVNMIDLSNLLNHRFINLTVEFSQQYRIRWMASSRAVEEIECPEKLYFKGCYARDMPMCSPVCVNSQVMQELCCVFWPCVKVYDGVRLVLRMAGVTLEIVWQPVKSGASGEHRVSIHVIPATDNGLEKLREADNILATLIMVTGKMTVGLQQ